MGNETLSKLQMKHYQELKSKFTENKSKIINLSDEEFTRLREVIQLLIGLGYVKEIKIDGANAFQRIGNFDDFEAWHKDREREERKLSSRELKIAIVSAIIGAVIGLVPFLFEVLKS